MVVVATDAPIDHRNLNRLAARAMMGVARTGSSGSNGSGDYAIAFSTAAGVRIQAGSTMYQLNELLSNDSMSPLFEAVIEATEEAIDNSMFRAHDMIGNGHTVKALPLEETIDILKKHGAISK
jgi:D-aminopeptidase